MRATIPEVRRTLAVWAALLIGGGPACLLRLDNEISCGDGFLDESAGEECEPSLTDSYENKCPGLYGVAACDPNTCQVINDAAQCSACGDGVVDVERGEECDGDSLNGNVCPGGNGALQCSNTCQLDFSECEACGNGVVDEGEECDYADQSSIDAFADPRQCAGSDDETVAPLSSPTKPFSSGSTTLCRTDCRWDRSGCGFCGDGVQDDSIPVQDGVSTAPEWCDGERFDPLRLEAEFGPLCPDPAQRPAVTCGANCQSFDPINDGCCLRRNAACPDLGIGEPGGGGTPGDTGSTGPSDTGTDDGATTGATTGDGDPVIPCCWEVAHPNEEPCYTSFEAGGEARRLCK